MAKSRAESDKTVFNDEASTTVRFDGTVHDNIGREQKSNIDEQREMNSEDIHTANMKPDAEKAQRKLARYLLHLLHGIYGWLCTQPNVAEFLVFRLLTGMAAASYMSTGGGTVADLLPKEERGVAKAIFTAGPLFGPTGLATAITVLFMHETSPINKFKSKAARLRKETGSPDLRAAGDRQTLAKQLVLYALTRPTVALISLYIAFNFGVTMLLLATFPTLSDRLLKAEGGNYRAERRLIMMMFVSPMFLIELFIYGWTTEYKVHWVVPIIGIAICGPGAVIINSSSQTYIIDIFGHQGAASALAAITLLRNLTGAFLPLAAPTLYANLGLGWGNSVLAFITVAFIPVPIYFYVHGASLRKRFSVEI
ncbi:hypothetical protein FANTH_9005 [Fusarium anthophilum]|uniref:Major facilitator superfamily transporter n=1 Tax=Fusarium anthophilum TaxID=48485 RepID=A0A8H5DZN1_9HYPO|nr:hypothetical protein FANTH_9005 [Fusarium anthophilum]